MFLEHCKIENAWAAYAQSAVARPAAQAKFAFAVKRRRRRLKIKLPYDSIGGIPPKKGFRAGDGQQQDAKL
jgi:hypothetical protein